MNVERYTRFELLAQLCPNNIGVKIFYTDTGMFAILEWQKYSRVGFL